MASAYYAKKILLRSSVKRPRKLHSILLMESSEWRNSIKIGK